MSRTSHLHVPLGTKALLPCVVTVTVPGATPTKQHYDGLFPSTTDAVLDAMDRFPNHRAISAKPRGKQR